ncbi:unnamed protein product [Arabidopsis thaliana]|uniref:Uncharacterized protein n=1 Tax=Arabidopsis thaliana TaxID=3702 RepID=A0A654F2D4_ARATH|nr:unnamed protein product [Arabidopsis thaliana]
MCDRDLNGMTLFELMLFEGRLLDALTNVKAQMLEPRMDEIARQLKHVLKTYIPNVYLSSYLVKSSKSLLTLSLFLARNQCLSLLRKRHKAKLITADFPTVLISPLLPLFVKNMRQIRKTQMTSN